MVNKMKRKGICIKVEACKLDDKMISDISSLEKSLGNLGYKCVYGKSSTSKGISISQGKYVLNKKRKKKR